MIQQCGDKLVRIDDILIPAVNIRVDGFPKYVNGVWFNIYFEIYMPGNALWVVEHHADAKGSWCGCGDVYVEELDWWMTGIHDRSRTTTFPTWDMFAEYYRKKVV